MKLLAIAAAAAAALPIAHAAPSSEPAVCYPSDVKCIPPTGTGKWTWIYCDIRGHWVQGGECDKGMKCIYNSFVKVPFCEAE